MLRRIFAGANYYRLMVAYVRLLGRRDHARALAAGERVLAVRPRDSTVLATMAGAAAELGRDDEARQLWLRALEVEPENFELLCRLASSFVAAGDHERAYPLVRRALANVPPLPEPVNELGLRLNRLIGLFKRRPDAVERYRRQHERHQSYLEGWLEWAADYVEWCEAVLEPGSEYVH